MRIYIAAVSSAVFIGSALLFAFNYKNRHTAARIEHFLASHAVKFEKPIVIDGSIFSPYFLITSPSFSVIEGGQEYVFSDTELRISSTSAGGFSSYFTEGLQLKTLPIGPIDHHFMPLRYALISNDHAAPVCNFRTKSETSFIEQSNSSSSTPDYFDVNCLIPPRSSLTETSRNIKIADLNTPFSFSYSHTLPKNNRQGSFLLSSSFDITVSAPPPRPHSNLSDLEKIYDFLEEHQGNHSLSLKTNYSAPLSKSGFVNPFRFSFVANLNAPLTETALNLSVKSFERANNHFLVQIGSNFRLNAKPDFKLSAQKFAGLAAAGDKEESGTSSASPLTNFFNSLPNKERMIPEFMNLIPDFYAVGPLEQSLEMELSFKAAPHTSDYQIDKVKIKDLTFAAGTRRVSGSGYLNLSPIPEGTLHIECGACEATFGGLLNYASEAERFFLGFSNETIKSPFLTEDHQAGLLSFAKQISERHSKDWLFRASLKNGKVMLGQYPIDDALSVLSDSLSRPLPPRSAPQDLNLYLENPPPSPPPPAADLEKNSGQFTPFNYDIDLEAGAHGADFDGRTSGAPDSAYKSTPPSYAPQNDHISSPEKNSEHGLEISPSPPHPSPTKENTVMTVYEGNDASETNDKSYPASPRYRPPSLKPADGSETNSGPPEGEKPRMPQKLPPAPSLDGG